MGLKKAAILQNHGLLTLGETIESAVFWYLSLEKSCRVQLMVRSALDGTEKAERVSEDDARDIRRRVGTEASGWFAGLGEFNWLEHKEQGRYGTWDGPEPVIDPSKSHLKNA